MFKRLIYLLLITQLLCIDIYLCSIANKVSILNNNDNYDEETFGETLSKILSLRKRDTDEEPNIPDESQHLSNTTTLSIEPSLPAENAYSVHKTTMKEPLLPVESINITERTTEKHEPTIPNEGHIIGLSFNAKQEESLPNELLDKIEINKTTQHESAFLYEKEFNIYKTTLSESLLPDENPINRIKRGDINKPSEPPLPDENLIFDWTRTTKVEPTIVSENINVWIKTTAKEPTIPEEIIDAHTAALVTEPSIPSEITRISLRTTASEPKLPQEDTKTIASTHSLTNNTPTTVEAVTENVTQTTTEQFITTTHSNLTSNTINTADTTTSIAISTTDIKTVASTATTAKVTTTTTTTTPRTTTTTAKNDELEVCSKQLCPNNSYCNADHNSADKCVCDAENGFIKDKTISSLTCKHLTPCDHSLSRCGKAKCIETGKDIGYNKGYRCDCDVGYELVSVYRQEKDYYCKPVKCRYPLITRCSQKCDDTETDNAGNLNNNPEYRCGCYSGYNLVGDKNCVLDNSTTCTINCGIYGYCANNRCECKTGFMFNSSDCVIDREWCARNCDNKCIISNYTVVCDCDSPNKKPDTQTGLCLTVNHCQSNGDGKLDCDRQNAVCVQSDDKNDTKGYRCECSIVGTKRVGDKCVAICDIAEYIDECNNNNAMCVYDMSRLKRFRCDCKPGFFRATQSNQESCLLAQHTLKTSLVLRNPYLLKEQKEYYDSNPNNNIDQMYSSLTGEQKANFIRGDLINQLQHSLSVANITGLKGVSLIDCRVMQTFIEYECEVTLQMDANYAEGNQKLEKVINSCATPINDRQYCYLPPKTIYAKTQFSAEPLRPCVDTNDCQSMSAYTECNPIPHTTRYNCLCPKNTFTVSEVKFMGESSRIEYCEDVNECDEGKCSGLHQTCINTVGWYMCTCHDGYKNASHSGDDCIPVCDNVLCVDGHGQCTGRGNSFWCTCDDGYSGEYCELKASAYIGSGYVISISVLALALLLVSLFAAYCLGRAKGARRVSLSFKIPINNNDVRPHFRRTGSIPEVPARTVYRHRNVEQTYEEKQV